MSLAGLCFGKNAFLHERIAHALQGCDRVLDIGCGPESIVRGSVGMDVFEPVLKAAKRRHRAVVAARAPDLPFRNGSFDAVVALDVIEHLERPQGERLIAEMERVSRDRVVIFTPNGFLPQGALDGNPFQIHRSGWLPEEFARRGYSIVGINGVRGLRGEGAELRWKPRTLWRSLSCITQGMLYRFPSLCFQILCVKHGA